MRKHDASAGVGRSLLNLITLIEDALLVAILGAMVCIAAAQILLRNLFDMGLAWGDPSLRVLVLWVGLMGAITASRDNKHINIDVLLRFFGRRARAFFGAVVGAFTLLVCGIVAFYAARFVFLDFKIGITAFAGIPVWILDLILPAGFGLIALRYLLFTATKIKECYAGEDRS